MKYPPALGPPVRMVYLLRYVLLDMDIPPSEGNGPLARKPLFVSGVPWTVKFAWGGGEEGTNHEMKAKLSKNSEL